MVWLQRAGREALEEYGNVFKTVDRRNFWIFFGDLEKNRVRDTFEYFIITNVFIITPLRPQPQPQSPQNKIFLTKREIKMFSHLAPFQLLLFFLLWVQYFFLLSLNTKWWLKHQATSIKTVNSRQFILISTSTRFAKNEALQKNILISLCPPPPPAP